MKKINTKTILTGYDGTPILNPQKEAVTIGYLLSEVLAGKVSNPQLGWQLGKRLATEDEVDLKAEDVVFLKKELEANSKSDRGFTAILAGQAIEILDGKE